MSQIELIEEIARLKSLIISLANRIADASEVLGKVAERKEMRKVESSASR